MDLSLPSMKTNNWSADNFKKSPQWVVHLSPRYSHVTLVSGYPFDSCQLSITWMSTIKLNTDYIECFHMTSRRPYWCPRTMKRRPCWCPKPVLWELNSFLMQTLSFVPINLHRCWPREWKRSIYIGHLASNARSLQENSQWERALISQKSQRSNCKFVKDQWNLSHDSLIHACSLSASSFGKKKPLF